jgi:hypothetical protein
MVSNGHWEGQCCIVEASTSVDATVLVERTTTTTTPTLGVDMSAVSGRGVSYCEMSFSSRKRRSSSSGSP